MMAVQTNYIYMSEKCIYSLTNVTDLRIWLNGFSETSSLSSVSPGPSVKQT